jgi:chemotaxis protein MotB
MALRRRGTAAANALNPWPGYVDALSTLLMVIIFVLLVFVLAQAFLSVALRGRDQALDRLGRQVAQLADMLSLERGKSADLQGSVTELTAELKAAGVARDDASAELSRLQASLATVTADRDALRQNQAALKAGAADTALELQSAQARLQKLQTQLVQEAGNASQQANVTIEKLADQVRGLMALRDQLQAQIAADTAKADQAARVSDAARTQIALLTQQVGALRAQLAQATAALDVSAKSLGEKDAKIADLGGRLNQALMSKVAELQRYRSEFFGRLRQVLANRPGISVVGDRFVFQSEVLFPVGSADLTQAGTDEIKKLAATLKGIAKDIPPDVNWVLRVDGHADRQLIHRKFASNWELSADRAINVVKLLIASGIPPERLAATGFGEFQPLDKADTPVAYAKNRRIELRLTDR